MIRAILCSIAAACLLAGCGIKRPLVAPKDIPAYEKERQEKIRKRNADVTTGTPPAEAK